MSEISYRVRILRPETQRIEVEVAVRDHAGGEALLSLPRWAPGWYVFRDYARNVEAVRAESARGRELPVDKTAVSTWRVRTGRNRSFTATFTIYAGKWGDAYSHVDATHASLFGPSVFPFLHGATETAASVALEVPEVWRHVSSGLPTAGGHDRILWAEDYDHLIDAPIEIGNHEVHAFEVEGRPHELAIVGGPVPTPAERMTADLARIVEQAGRLFGDLPYERYVFLLYVTPSPTGSLEHRNSTTLTMKPECFVTEPLYVEKFLATASHEFFHLYNVKRIRPAELVPLDYLVEQRTSQMWVFEGLTSYYDDLLLVRAGLMDEKTWLGKLGKNVSTLRNMPGRRLETLADSSLDAWVKFMVKDENWQNRGISFYTKGLLLGIALDLAIRERSGDRRSLDDVMRGCFVESQGRSYRGLTAKRFRDLAEEAAGAALPEIFETGLATTEELDLEAALAAAGWKLEPDRKKGEGLDRAEKDEGWLGAETETKEGRLLVAKVPLDTPAMAAGLAPGDELLFADGRRIEDAADLVRRVRWTRPGTTLELTISRYGRRMDLPVELGPRPVTKWKVTPARKSSAAAKRRRAALLKKL